MSEHSHAAIAFGQGPGIGRNLAQFLQQLRCDRVAFADIAAHRHRIAAVAEEIEGYRDIAVTRQRFGKWLHQLLGAGEAVCDQDHGSRRGRPGLEDRDGRFADVGVHDEKSATDFVQLKKSDRYRKNGHDCDSKPGTHESSPAICFLRMLRTVHQIENAAIGTNAAVTMLGSIAILPLSCAAFTR